MQGYTTHRLSIALGPTERNLYTIFGTETHSSYLSKFRIFEL